MLEKPAQYVGLFAGLSAWEESWHKLGSATIPPSDLNTQSVFLMQSLTAG
ncbi:MAG: hypothetical protein ACI8WB_003119 [Phenylobacterium sp.]|jgi:hypothetical protein